MSCFTLITPSHHKPIPIYPYFLVCFWSFFLYCRVRSNYWHHILCVSLVIDLYAASCFGCQWFLKINLCGFRWVSIEYPPQTNLLKSAFIQPRKKKQMRSIWFLAKIVLLFFFFFFLFHWIDVIDLLANISKCVRLWAPAALAPPTVPQTIQRTIVVWAPDWPIRRWLTQQPKVLEVGMWCPISQWLVNIYRLECNSISSLSILMRIFRCCNKESRRMWWV